MAAHQLGIRAQRHGLCPREYHMAELAIALDPSSPRHRLPRLGEQHARVLDVGCGAGQSLVGCGFDQPHAVREGWGVDLDADAIALGRERWPHLRLFEGQGEALPCPDQYFDLVFSRVALPYMDIPRALGEFARVLRPGGDLWIAAHPLRMTVSELARAARTGAWKSALFRGYVLANGAYFHLTGSVLPAPGRPGTFESWQGMRGMRLALARAGFTDIRVHRTAPATALVVTARRPGAL